MVIRMKNRYGNTIKTVKHVTKIASVFWIVIFILFLITGYVHGNLGNSNSFFYILVIPSIIASILPVLVFITTFSNIVIDNETIYLLAFYKWRSEPQRIEKMTSVNIGRGLCSIHFEDGSCIRTLGMKLSEYLRIIKDLKDIRGDSFKINSNWLFLE